MQRTKQEIRRDIAARRKELDSEWRVTTSAEIVERFVALPEFESAEFVGLYLAIAGEVILDELLPICWARGKRTAIPVFNAELKIYEMAEITAETEFATGHYGIREPIAPTLVSIRDINLLAVPGVAFDRSGNRLGRGGGYYDRLLADFTGTAAAVAFGFQLIDAVPVDDHDLPVNSIIAEKETIRI